MYFISISRLTFNPGIYARTLIMEGVEGGGRPPKLSTVVSVVKRLITGKVKPGAGGVQTPAQVPPLS